MKFQEVLRFCCYPLGGTWPSPTPLLTFFGSVEAAVDSRSGLLFVVFTAVSLPFLPLCCPTPPRQDEFIENQEMPTERFRAAAVNVSEHVYLFGGRDVAGNLVREELALSRCETNRISAYVHV